MSDLVLPKPRGRPFEKGRSGNPGGRRRGSRNKATLAAAALLAGESEALPRKAVEMALGGEAMRLCMERVLPPCRERTVKFSLPPIEAARTGKSCGRRPTTFLWRWTRSLPHSPAARSRRARWLSSQSAADFDGGR